MNLKSSNIVHYNKETIISEYTFGCTKLKGTEEKTYLFFGKPCWETKPFISCFSGDAGIKNPDLTRFVYHVQSWFLPKAFSTL